MTDRYAEVEQRLRQNVYKAAFRYGTSPEDEAVFATALDRLLAYREARAQAVLADRWCPKWNNDQACNTEFNIAWSHDKERLLWCPFHEAQATLDKLSEEAP